MTDFVTEFLTGFAELFAAADLAVWQSATGYDPGDVAIGLHALPTLNPTCVGLFAYPLTDDPTLSISAIGLQVKARVPSQDVRDVRALIGPFEELLLGNYPLILPNGIRVNSIAGNGPKASLGMDELERQIWASSFPCSVMRPSAHRL